MLIVRAHNLGTREGNVADYEVTVHVNLREIARLEVTGFDRAEGWPNLLRAIADAADFGKPGAG
jgi:hypothetical protein